MEITATFQANIDKARNAIFAGDRDAAFISYADAFLEIKTHLEAKWFSYALSALSTASKEGSLTDKDIDSLAGSFTESYGVVLETIDFIATEEEHKAALAQQMVEVLKLLGRACTERGLGKSVIEYSKPIGQKIIDTFGSEEPYTSLAVEMWKETIYLRHTFCVFRNFQDKDKETWYDKMIKDIQSYEPDYVAPQFEQAGCLMFGDKAKEASKVLPGM